MPKKAKREVIKHVKRWCEKEGHTYVGYEHGSCGHDVVKVSVWDNEINTTVACTPANGAQSAGKRAVIDLKKKHVRLVQRIAEGRNRRSRKR